MLILAQTTEIDWLTQGGAIGVLAFIVVAFLRGWIVTGREHEAMRKERDRALDMVYEHAEITKRALEVSEKVT